MKRIAIYVSTMAIIIGVYGQKVKYEDDLNRILTLSTANSVAELNKWLALEPSNPSISLQLGVLYKKRYDSADPLMDFKYKFGNAELALISLRSAQLFVDEKEVKRNDEVYFNFGSYNEKGKLEVPYDTIASFITSSQAELSSYMKNAKSIQEEFRLSFSHYDRAHKIYSEILGKYPTFKELYLLFDDNVDAQFEDLKQEYLTFLDHWGKYKAAEDTFDIGYDQNIRISEINTYRLDGLQAEINFLKNDIEVWDYAKWVDQTRASIDVEISSLRNSLIAEDMRLNKEIDKALPDFIRDDFKTLTVSKEALFNLRKYDLSSVVEPIFLFKQKQHDLLHQKLQSESLDSSATVDMERKLYLYGQILNKVKLADSTLADVLQRNTDANYKKYKTFVDTQYKGMNGVKTFVGAEQAKNATAASEAVSKIKDSLQEHISTENQEETITHKRMQIPLNVVQPIEAEFLTANPITTHKLRTFDGAYILGGIYKNEKENKVQAFVCALTAEKKVAWFNDYLLMQDSSAGFDSNTRLAAMSFVPGGVALILNGEDMTGENRINQLIMLDEKGNSTLSKRLLFNQYPRTMTFSEARHNLFITFKGEYFSETLFKESELLIASYNILGDLQWQQRMAYKGDVIAVISADKGKVIIGNYNEMKGLNGRIKRAGTKNTDSNIYALKVDEEGNFVSLKTIEQTAPICVNLTYKVSDDCINLFGTKGNYVSSSQLNTDESSSLHVILDSDLEVLHSSL